MRVDDIFEDPSLLSGKLPGDILTEVEFDDTWRTETLRRGSRRGQGWVLREYREDGTASGRVIRWHPGSGRHGAGPYWRVSSPSGGRSVPIR